MARSCRRGFLPFLVAAILAIASPAGATISEAGRLSAVYDAILSARFDQATQELAAACPKAPPETCKALGSVAVWWQIQLDLDSRSLDSRFERVSSAAVAAAQAWTDREPRRAEAWFFLAGSYAPIAQWKVLRGERLSAARDGNRIRIALERALALDPSLEDAHFGIGLYHYYADVVPLGAKLLRMLLLMPGGDRVRGMQEMLQARNRGELLRGEADYQLHWLYLWYEHQPQRALELLRGLDRRYPSNPLFLQRIAEVERDDLGDHGASAAVWQELLDRARAGRCEDRVAAEVRARIGLGRELVDLSQNDRAVDQLTQAIAIKSDRPYAAPAIAEYELGRAHDRAGRRAPAIASYERAIALAPPRDETGIVDRARVAIRRLK